MKFPRKFIYGFLGAFALLWMIDFAANYWVSNKFYNDREYLREFVESLDVGKVSSKISWLHRCKSHQLGLGYVARTCFRMTGTPLVPYPKGSLASNTKTLDTKSDEYKEHKRFLDDNDLWGTPMVYVPPFRHFAIIRDFFHDTPGAKRLFILNSKMKVVKEYNPETREYENVTN